MDPKHYIRFFEYHQWMSAQHTAGVTDEESCRAPAAGGNSMNWILGHIAASRNDILKLIGEPPVWSDEEASPYVRGSAGLTDPAAARPLAEILDALKRSHAAIKARLETIRPEELQAPIEKGTVEDALSFLQFHETYHMGQVGLARRWLAKEGVIK